MFCQAVSALGYFTVWSPEPWLLLPLSPHSLCKNNFLQVAWALLLSLSFSALEELHPVLQSPLSLRRRHRQPASIPRFSLACWHLLGALGEVFLEQAGDVCFLVLISSPSPVPSWTQCLCQSVAHAGIAPPPDASRDGNQVTTVEDDPD